ncbi:MAG TPA: CHAT domain-containing protein, partial [Tepidisphaeraceae bacterium]|nr:CHAT domain-containing protein [Tepidisphaeraceae bacterium]
DWSGNYEENCTRLAKHLGKNKIRRKLFDVIYSRGSKPRSKKQLMAAVGLTGSYSQQAQNQLDHLALYGLIVSDNNDGAVDDGSRWVYSKEPHVRAHRKSIVKFADRPALAKNVPTKRNHVAKVVTMRTITRSILRRKKHLNVLYSTSNPNINSPLRVDVEMRQVQEAVRGSRLRENIVLHYRPAVDLQSIMDALNDLAPGIVHFSGHGYSGGIAVDNADVSYPSAKALTFDLLAKAITSVDKPPQVIVLNSCHSAGAKKVFFPAARAIIAMGDSISDLAATAFAARFYAAIAAGQSLKAAFAQGVVAIEAVSLNEANTPKLILADGINAAAVVLV